MLVLDIHQILQIGDQEYLQACFDAAMCPPTDRRMEGRTPTGSSDARMSAMFQQERGEIGEPPQGRPIEERA